MIYMIYILFVLMTSELILSCIVLKKEQNLLLYNKIKANKKYYFIFSISSNKFKLYKLNNLLYDNIDSFKITMGKCYFIICSTGYIINVFNNEIQIFAQINQSSKKELRIFQLLMEEAKTRAEQY